MFPDVMEVVVIINSKAAELNHRVTERTEDERGDIFLYVFSFFKSVSIILFNIPGQEKLYVSVRF